MLPIEMIVDDGANEDSVGLNSSSAAFQFVWFNRFTPAPTVFPFNLTQIDVYFDSAVGVAVGNSIELVVYQDADGNPANGAQLLKVIPQTVQAVGAWSSYTLAEPVLVSGPGDVLIGVVDRFVTSGSTAPNYPAAIDTTASQVRSWVASWTTDPPNPPVLPADDLMGTIDSLGFAGNWLVRGYGVPATKPIDWLSESPITGTVPALMDQVIDLTFDANYPVGVYSGTLSVNSNDPVHAKIVMPVDLTILPNPNAGFIQGTITTDRPAGAKQGATVNLKSAATGWTTSLTTNASGYFEKMILPADLGVFTITVSAAGFVTDVHTRTLAAPGPDIHNVQLRSSSPWIQITPALSDKTLVWGNSATDTFQISNNGPTALTYNISTEFTENFEIAVPPTGWLVFDNVGSGNVWARNDYFGRSNLTTSVGGSGFSAAADSDATCDGSAWDTTLVSPPIDLTGTSAATLDFASYFQDYLGAGDAWVDVSTNGGLTWTNIFYQTEDDPSSGTHRTLNLSPFTGNVIYIAWTYSDNGDGCAWYWQIDSVKISQTLNWLNWAPASGSVAPGASQVVTLTMNSAPVPAPGVYHVSLNISNNDLFLGVQTFPVTMRVTANANQMHLYGTVTGNRTPTGVNMPLKGMTVTAAGPTKTFTTQTAANGSYEFYMLPAYTGNYTVTVTDPSAKYLPNVAPLTLAAGDNIIHNVTLVLDSAFLTIAPEAVTQTLDWGASTTVPMTVSNPLPATKPLSAALFEIMGSYTPPVVQTVSIQIPAGKPYVEKTGVVIDDVLTPASPARELSFKLENLALGKIKVLIMSDDTNQNALSGLDEWLRLYPDLEVYAWGAADGFPKLVDLMPYQVIIFGGRYSFSNISEEWSRAALGELLASYVDMGGGVILIQNGWMIDDDTGSVYSAGGRFETQYSPVDYRHTPPSPYTAGTRTLGVYAAGHPLMQGVTTITDNLRAFTDLVVRPYAETVALYNDGNVYVAATPGKVVLLNQVLTYGAAFTGNVPTLVHNAILYLAPSDAAWLSKSATSFNVPVGGTAPLTASLNASAVSQPGTYKAWLWFNNNDVLQQGAYVPVTMNVNADATMGQLLGTVTLDRDESGLHKPAVGADVTITSTVGVQHLTTNALGKFTFYFTAAQIGAGLNVQVAAKYPDYQDAMRTVTLHSSQVTNGDLEVKLRAPWISEAPASLEVTLQAGAKITETLGLDNFGLEALTFNFLEVPPTATLPLQATDLLPIVFSSSIDPVLSGKIAAGQQVVDFLVMLRTQPNTRFAAAMTEDARGEYVLKTRQNVTQASQAELLAYLAKDSRVQEYKPYYIMNVVYVRGDASLVGDLAGRSDVLYLRANRTYELPIGMTQVPSIMAPDAPSMEYLVGESAGNLGSVWYAG